MAGRLSRRGAALALAAVVLALHLWGGDELLGRLALGAPAVPAIQRIEVAFVRELLPTAAPAPAPRPAPRARPQPARRATPPASAPELPPESPPEPAQDPLPEPVPESVAALGLEPPAEPASTPQPTPPEPSAEASAPAPAASQAQPADAAASAAPAAPAFEWPASTRLAYKLNGNYRGEVQGQASVEWLREGLRYQVHLQALVGPAFAPLMARRLSSEGELTEQGLKPQRFAGEQRIGFGTRRWALAFGPEAVTLADGSRREAQPGVQDEASQFVQLAWLFTVQPQALAAGHSVEFPLALPRRVDRWTYDVIGEDTLSLPFGELKAMHLKPRRSGRAGELTAQIWIAPTLQNLPVRILIHQDAQTYVDLVLERPPLQALR